MFESGFKRFPFEEYNPPFNFMECHWLFRLLSLDYGQDICASIFRHPGSLSWKKVKHFEFFTLILNPLLFLSTVGHRTKTLDFGPNERSFIKCEQTNLISVVSKLENLLTKLIFQFSLPSLFSSPTAVVTLCLWRERERDGSL